MRKITNQLMKFVTAFFLFCMVFPSLSAQEKRDISFSKDVFPILKARCLKCHEKDEENPNSFAMDTYDLLMSGGKYGKAVLPGKGNESYLVIKLRPNPPKGAQMPTFSKKKLSENDVELIKHWIDQGAKNN